MNTLLRRPRFLLALLFLSLGALCVPGFAAPAASSASDQEDARVVEEMRGRMVEIQRQLLATSDLAEQARLQKSMMAILEETLPKLSAKARPMLVVATQVVTPIQQASAAYMGMIGEYAAAPESDFTTIKSREDIPTRLERIDRLAEANQSLIKLLTGFRAAAEKALDEHYVSAADKRDFLTGFDQGFGRQVGPTMAIRNLDTGMFEKLREALHLLDSGWGKWKAVEGQPLEWSDEQLENQFVGILQDINQLAERQAKAQQVLSERL